MSTEPDGLSGGRGRSLSRMTKGVPNFVRYNQLLDVVDSGGVSEFGSSSDGVIVRRTLAWITGHVRDGSKFRWFYSLKQIGKIKSGYGNTQWGEVDKGLVCTASSQTMRAYHYAENMNGSTGQTGSDINIDNLPKDAMGNAAYELQPVGNNVILFVDHLLLPDGSIEFWFERLSFNGVDGTCPAASSDDGGTP